MPPEAIGELLKLGLPGIVIMALAFWGWSKDKKLDEVNEKRIAESRETVKAIEQNTNTLESLSDVLKDRRGGA